LTDIFYIILADLMQGWNPDKREKVLRATTNFKIVQEGLGNVKPKGNPFTTEEINRLQYYTDKARQGLQEWVAELIKIALSSQSKKTLDSFKKVVDAIMEKEVPFSDYVDIVIDKGVKGIISDIIPKEPGVLWNTIERINEVNPKFFCEFVVEVLKRGEESNRKAAKEKIGFIKR